ncbi:MAG: hypothetical protein Q8M77_06270 [Hydrogenophaga sp.]|nr:hypothetical protein [Hydrogenophaga sp.]
MPAEHPTNRVLAALSRADLLHWQPHLERVELNTQHTLQTPDAPIEFVHFPVGALVGLVHVARHGAVEAPVALVGNDGVLGMTPLLGVEVERMRAVVLHPGSAWRLPIAALPKLPLQGSVVLHVVSRYLQTLNVQMAQTALCRLSHTVPQRLCRWLLDAFDRVPGEALDIDVAELGAWLDADSDAVREAASQLVAAGVIERQTGRTLLRDRAALANCACSCHALVKHQVEQMFPPAF